MSDLIIIKGKDLNSDQMQQIAHTAEAVTAKLTANESTSIVVDGDLTIYRLAPGESTDMLDAKAELIRAGLPPRMAEA